MALRDIPKDISDKYEIYEWKHACAILKNDYPSEWQDLIALLREFRLKKSWITEPGGRKSQLAIWVDQFMNQQGWIEKQFLTSVTVDNNKYDSPTHKVDCYKNQIAIEIEWNNKDPSFQTLT